jgi:hypothetical protein
MYRRNRTFVEELVFAPWQISLVLAPLSYVTFRWIVPANISEQFTFRDAFIEKSLQFAPLSFYLFGAISALSAIVGSVQKVLRLLERP